MRIDRSIEAILDWLIATAWIRVDSIYLVREDARRSTGSFLQHGEGEPRE